jgi:molecular chaperone DnaK
LSDPIVGIDLGTSNSVVAHTDASGTVRVLADDAGYKVHPSVVSFHPSGGVVVGAAAKQRKVIDPQNTIYSVKRLIGRSYRAPEVQTAKSRSPFLIKEGAGGAPAIATRAGEFAVPEISAIVLDHVRNVAAARLETAVSRAVVTVPASFNDAQRSATATAGAIAGLTVVRVLNEPTAAALAYGHTRQLRQIIAVYDFGGGTFDITFLKLDDQVYEVLGTSGDTFLGGDDLDERLVDKMAAKFLAENRIDLKTNEVAMMRLRAVAEQTKIELSRRSRAVVRIDEIAYGPRGAPLNLMIEINRDEFVREVADLIDRTFPVCRESMTLASLSLDQIDDVILVGGTTKIPYVREQVGKFFGKTPRTDVSPEDAVAAGAALQATSLERILSRRPSSKLAVPPRPPAADEETTAGPTDVLELADPESGATMAPSELTVAARDRPAQHGDARRAGPHVRPDARPDTSYSVTRAGVRDEVADADRLPRSRPGPTPPPDLSAAPSSSMPSADSGFETRTPPTVQTLPLGRITRAVPEVGTPPGQRTILGVPPAPGVDINLDSGVFPNEPPTRPTTSGAATPPPLPRSTQRQGAAGRPPPHPQMTAQLPTVQRPPDRSAQAGRTPLPAGEVPTTDWIDGPALHDRSGPESAAGTQSDAWAARTPATTQPMAPTSPIAPPTEPTLIAVTADVAPPTRGPGAQTLITEPSPSSTARGFQPPQSYPVQPMPPVPQPAMPPRPAPIVLEVTPRGLGIGTVAGFCEELIRRNARLPTETRKLFTTSRDRQDLVRIVVCQGESRRLDKNTVIGDLILQNLPPRPRGETSIEVTFSLDASGLLHVRARDAQTGAEQRATLDLVGGVPQEDVATSRDRLQQLRR